MNYQQLAIQLLAAYGTDAYGCGAYNSIESCQTDPSNLAGEPQTTQETGILAPLTGLMDQPPAVLLPTLLLVGVLIGTMTYFVSRAIKRRRS